MLFYYPKDFPLSRLLPLILKNCYIVIKVAVTHFFVFSFRSFFRLSPCLPLTFTYITSSRLIYFPNVFFNSLTLSLHIFLHYFGTHCSLGSLLFSLSFIYTELCDAATRIQAAFRGHLARKTGGEDGVELKDDKDLQEITKKVAEELDIDLNDPELHRAATKIQASFRGHKVRKDTTA